MSEEEKYCTLVFDEMQMKNFLEYSKYIFGPGRKI